MAGDGGVDRLSSLSDDILRLILHLVPLKEAASTTVLSRRWRAPLWLSSGAVNLETGIVEKKKHRPRRQGHEHNNAHARFFSGTDDLVAAATAALDAADVPVTRLSLVTWNPNYYEVASHYKDFAEVVLSHPAARSVKELLLVAKDPSGKPYERTVMSKVTLDSLPHLETLQLTNCYGVLLHHSEALLPRMSSLRLSNCIQPLGDLQRVIDAAAPALAAVRLESVFITHKEVKEAKWRRLRCPAAIELVLDSCGWQVKVGPPDGTWYFEKTVHRLEIDAVRLRRFFYKGILRDYKFTPQPLELEQVDLEFVERTGYWVKDPNDDLETFWRFARNFTATKEMMRLRVSHLEDIAVLSEARQLELLPTFRCLESLEFQGAHWTKDKTAAVTTILNLLHCCPVLTSLRINLTAEYDEEEEEDASKNKQEKLKHKNKNKHKRTTTRKEEEEEKEKGEDNSKNEKGVHKHKHKHKRTTTRNEIVMAAMVGPRYLFQCLQTSLRRVDLQFHLAKKDCLGVKLIKTFAENAMVLEEIRIDSGDEKLCEHMKPRIAKWNSSRRELGATSFMLLPLN